MRRLEKAWEGGGREGRQHLQYRSDGRDVDLRIIRETESEDLLLDGEVLLQEPLPELLYFG